MVNYGVFYAAKIIAMTLVFSSCVVMPEALAQTAARESLQKLKTPALDHASLYRILRLAKQKPYGKMMECDVFPEKCTPGNLLLFRGEGRFQYPSISGLVRSRWSGSSYAKGKDLSATLAELQKQLSVFAGIDSAPGGDSSEKADRVVLHENLKSGTFQWWAEIDGDEENPGTRTKKNAVRSRIENGKKIERNFRQLLYTFHTSANYLHYFDSSNKKVTSIDPLISFSSQPWKALSYALDSFAPEVHHPDGNFIVLSVPESSLINLCSSTAPVTLGEVWNADECSEELNPYGTYNEYEYDVVAYPKVEHIRDSFLVDWKEIQPLLTN